MKGHVWRVLIVVAIASLAGGCMPAGEPTTPDARLHPRVISYDATRFFRTGMTTRTDVLLQLGEPDFWWDDQGVFAYEWTDVTDRILWACWCDYPRWRHFLLLGFDEKGRLTREQRLVSQPSHPFSLDQLRKSWHSNPGGG